MLLRRALRKSEDRKPDWTCASCGAFGQVAEDNMNYFADFTRSVTGREVAPTQFVQAKAEELPFDDETFDIVVCTYLFHELPFPVRKQVLRRLCCVFPLVSVGFPLVLFSFSLFRSPACFLGRALFVGRCCCLHPRRCSRACLACLAHAGVRSEAV